VKPPRVDALAFKAYEIEELADVYFFRPLGLLVARAARRAGLTPTQVTIGCGAVGIVGGALLYDTRLGLLAFALLIMHGIVDSADGQLARLTGQVSELGRILDGLAGYVTYAVAYVALIAGIVSRGGSPSIAAWAVLAACANAVQAQMYDYHRTSYATIAIKGMAPRDTSASVQTAWARGLLRGYERAQRWLAGLHPDVEASVTARSANGRVDESDRARYRACFYWPVRGWNLLGDNTRFYAIGVLAWFDHLDWFFAFILLPMNAALAALWLWQRRADLRFLGVPRA
jgi:phosphatidylglycerophosphate synthase